MTVLRALLRQASSTLGPFLGLIAVTLLFAYKTGDFGLIANGEDPIFLSTENLRKILNQSAIIGVVSIGMTLVIVGGGIDLSVGSLVALAGVTVALVVDGRFAEMLSSRFLPASIAPWMLAAPLFAVFLALHFRATKHLHPVKTVLWAMVWTAGCFALGGRGPWSAAAAGVFIGLLFGHFNGLLVGTTGVAPFIVTLGAMEALRGVTIRMAYETKVKIADLEALQRESPWLMNLMSHDEERAWLGIVTPSVMVLATVALAAGLILNRTRLGRWILAVGSNEEAARLSGVPTNAVKLWMYSLMGLLAGVAGVMQFARLTSGDPTAGDSFELYAIAAVVIGGGSLRGGEGTVLGAILGTLLMGVLQTGCSLLRMDPSLTRIILGSVIVVAVTFDMIRHRNRRQ
jgi:ribose/xylose/arabinose/galactoside ABC-type transport system permease subunit